MVRLWHWIVLAVLIAAVPLWAGDSVWTTQGPWGRSMGAIAVDPVEPVTIYVASGLGIHVTTDGGESWSPAQSVFPNYGPRGLTPQGGNYLGR